MVEIRRRNFIKKSLLATFSTIIGADIVFGEQLPKGYVPLILDQQGGLSQFGKHSEMTLLNDRPWNAEAKAHLLDDEITPADKMFMRNNGHIPSKPDPATWVLSFDGESVRNPKSFTLEELKNRFRHYTYRLTLECGGNGRSEFNPPAKGNQWTIGAVSCAQWTGVRLRDVLEEVGVKDAVYVGYHAIDLHLSGDREKEVISRGVPLAKAMQDETLLAFRMNGEDIPLAHGFPLRLVAGGWPASASGKWVNRLSIRNVVHDGPKMTGTAYRVPCEAVAPGTEVSDENMCIIESMPVKSLITFPKSGALLESDQKLEVRGHAWAGELAVENVEISIDFGATWQKTRLQKPANRLAWQRWGSEINLPKKGYYEIWAKATDSEGNAQPMVVPGWNPKGYLNNACHRIAVKRVS